MTAVTTAVARPRPAAAPTRGALRLVARRPLAVGRLPFAIFVGTILAGGLVTLLMLHTLAAQDAFRLQRLQQTEASLSDTQQQLALGEQRLEAPHTLALRARALGMVPGGAIAFVKVARHGKIVGVAHAGAAPVAPSPATSPSAGHAGATATAAAGPKAATHARAKHAAHNSTTTRATRHAPARRHRAATKQSTHRHRRAAPNKRG